jgi:hypothetical protein
VTIGIVFKLSDQKARVFLVLIAFYAVVSQTRSQGVLCNDYEDLK